MNMGQLSYKKKLMLVVVWWFKKFTRLKYNIFVLNFRKNIILTHAPVNNFIKHTHVHFIISCYGMWDISVTYA